ncbi:hypothetical protein CDAR_305721 [Caerostris darwini]|uniref:Uncharacterized protein n=1 Tax=Caerostris darwini TaxID=1538125 RepID=A0AAV4VR87_9ARAC|nr:hypothetical protein CDAR_305721 [Caerostris darwini]
MLLLQENRLVPRPFIRFHPMAATHRKRATSPSPPQNNKKNPEETEQKRKKRIYNPLESREEDLPTGVLYKTLHSNERIWKRLISEEEEVARQPSRYSAHLWQSNS